MGKSSGCEQKRASKRASNAESNDRQKLNRRLQCVKKKKHSRFTFSNRGCIPFCGKNGILQIKKSCERMGEREAAAGARRNATPPRWYYLKISSRLL